MKIGMGYDSHRFVEGDGLMIGGVKIPANVSVVSHSDGDVLLHALVDAMLGAAALGDIGTLFPDTDAQFKNKNSAYFVEHVLKLLNHEKLKLQNIDATIIAETPRLQPHVMAIRQMLSNLLRLPLDCVSVKAKTNEQMGSIGRSEGIVAMVAVLVGA